MVPVTLNNSVPILLVEDDENDIILTELAYEVVGLANPLLVVRNGSEAIRYLSGDGIYFDRARYPFPGMILLDLNMPILTGFDVLEWLQCHPVKSKVIVVVLTASSNTADIDRAMSLGAADYRVKPNNSARLVPLLRELEARWLETDQSLEVLTAVPPVLANVPSQPHRSIPSGTSGPSPGASERRSL